MIVMSLDEYGRFENITKPTCMLIGGTVFQCENETDITGELKCLKTFFETICQENGGDFPADLHYLRDTNGEPLNANQVEKIKKALIAELPDYLNMRGRWSSGRSYGAKYYLYALVGDAAGIRRKSETESPISNLLDDEQAANRYDHMVYRAIENMIFYNPLLKDETEVCLHLATRTISAGDKKHAKDLTRLGYANRQAPDGSWDRSVYVNTDSTGFRAALQAAMLNNRRDDLQFRLDVRSINYKDYYVHQGFLYLADTVCSLYEEIAYKNKNLTEAFPALLSRCSETVPTEQVLLWAYHETDNVFRKICMEQEHGNIFEAMKMISDLQKQNNSVSKVYSSIWLEKVKKLLEGNSDPGAYLATLQKLDFYLGERNRNLQTAFEILELLKAQVPNLYDPYMKEKVQFLTAKTEMSLSNHTGNHERAEAVYQEVTKAIHYSDIEEMLGMQLVLCVSRSDALQFEDEEELVRNVIDHYSILSEIRKDLYPEAKGAYPSFGRAYSQLGQCLSYQERYTEAEECFRKANELFGDSRRDLVRTASYMMHTRIESGDRNGFEALIQKYYGISNALEAFTGADVQYDAWDLYVMLKAIWFFDRDQLTPKLVRRITKKIQKLLRTGGKDHPWEHICKYAVLLNLYHGGEPGKQIAEEFRTAMRNSILESSMTGILKRILEEAEKQCDNALNGREWMDGCELTYMYR